jgi:hypothetical protein
MTVAERFEDITTRAESRPIDAQALGRALLDFAVHGRLPRDASDLRPTALPADVAAQTQLVEDVREAVLDAEEALSLALGADPDGAWLALVDDCRDGGTVAADAALGAAAQGLTTGRCPSALGQLHAADGGRYGVRVE